MRRPTRNARRNGLASSMEDGGEGTTAPGVVEVPAPQAMGLGEGQWEMSLLQEVSDCLWPIQGEIVWGMTRVQARQWTLAQIVLRLVQAASNLAECDADESEDIPPALTKRQREVLNLMRTGMTAQAVARALCLSEQTVRSHIRDICARLGVSGITAAIHRARALGIIA